MLVVKTVPGVAAAGAGAIVPAAGDLSPAPPTISKKRFACMFAVYNLVSTVITVYIWILIASVVLSWLVAFNVVNTGNRTVYQVRDVLDRLTEPLLRPIRNLLPNLGGIDISPIILILALYFIRDLAFEFLRPF